MDRKTKLLAACAIGAVAVILGAGIARCAITAATGGEESAIEETAQTQAQEKTASGQQDEESSLAECVGTSWTSADGATLSIISDALVERKDDQTTVTYYEVESEKADAEGVSADISTYTTAKDTPKSCVLRIDTSGDKVTATCDAFQLAKSYTLDAKAETELKLAAHASRLNELMESDDSAITAAIAQWAATKSPYATTATWDGEVYVDCNDDTVTTGFTLDDGAGTVVQLKYDGATGKLSAL